MVTKTQLKQILQLKQKKYRLLKGLFVAEGEKTVSEFLSASWICKNLFSVKDNFHPKAQKIDFTDMSRITHFKNPSPVLGVFEIPKSFSNKVSQITIAVDGIKDPGNLGTIIRLCDWFGIDELLCSLNTVDCFNSKTVQSSMGSLVRVTCYYKDDLSKYLKSLKKPVIGAESGGKIYLLNSTS
jgi:TrmH family RNA methyltransferase